MPSNKTNSCKCPKCGCYDELIKCTNCGYEGKPKEFHAKAYIINYKVSARVVAFNKDEDLKKEAKEMAKLYGFNYLDYEIIEIKEGK